MNFKLVPIAEENENTFELSKIGGSPAFPWGFLQENSLENDLFVAQLNLSQWQIPSLPETGFLYFFLNVDEYPYQAKVVYTDDTVCEVYELINEYFDDFGDPSAYAIMLSQDETGLGICTQFNPDLDLDSQIETAHALNLLELDSLQLPQGVLTLGQPDGWYLFVIDEDDLKAGDFSNVTFLSYGS